MTEAPESLVGQLAALLDLSPLGNDMFNGPHKPGGVGRLFGGQIIAQALVAATHTVDPDRIAHSLHAYFIRPGSEGLDAQYQVMRDHDGRSFSTRRVAAMQEGEIILNFAASFQRYEEGLNHQDPMPDAPAPEGLPSEQELFHAIADRIAPERLAWFLGPRPIEFRPVDPATWLDFTPREGRKRYWARVVAPIGEDQRLHKAMLAYLTDMHLLGTCAVPHGLSYVREELMSASLDHAVWFHGDVRADEWMLFDSVSPWSNHGRGMNHGYVYARDGRQVATIAQEGMIRRRRV